MINIEILWNGDKIRMLLIDDVYNVYLTHLRSIVLFVVELKLLTFAKGRLDNLKNIIEKKCPSHKCNLFSFLAI